MLFSQYYNVYVEAGYLNRSTLTPLICSQTNVDIARDTMHREERRENLYYYLLYNDSCGDIENPKKPFICYDVYMKLYDKSFQREVRVQRVKRVEANTLLSETYGIPPRYYGKSFRASSFDNEIEEQKQLINTAKNWVKHGFPNTLLLGSKVRGVGKTFTAIGLLHEWYIKNDHNSRRRFKDNVLMARLDSSIIFLKERDLYDMVRATFSTHQHMTESIIVDILSNADMVVYDDMFSIKDSDFMDRIRYALIDKRVECNKKPMIITTNSSKIYIEKNEPDIYSRLGRGVIYFHSGVKDLRKEGY